MTEKSYNACKAQWLAILDAISKLKESQTAPEILAKLSQNTRSEGPEIDESRNQANFPGSLVPDYFKC